jgi:uncharacterized membrane protein (DUF2068 family)
MTMQRPHPPTFRGRTIGITTLTALQFLIGGVHVFFGFWLLTASVTLTPFSALASNTIYSVYTVAFGFAAAVLAFGIWLQKNWGTYGTIALSLFVITADSLTVLDLPSIPGIPKFAAGTEIIYSLIITVYLFQAKIRTK